MAQKMQVFYTDDLDGGEAAGTVRFGYDGVDYEIDLNTKNSEKLASALAPFIKAGRRVPARRASRGVRHGTRTDMSGVREWARGQGIEVSGRGRIPAEVIARYEAAR
jgi:hypothetical protein